MLFKGYRDREAFLILGSFSLLMTVYGNTNSLIGFFYINFHKVQHPHSYRMFVNVVTLFGIVQFFEFDRIGNCECSFFLECETLLEKKKKVRYLIIIFGGQIRPVGPKKSKHVKVM